MKSRLVVLTTLVLGMLLSTAGAGLAVSGISGNAAQDQYETPTPTPPTTGGGGVLGDEDTGSGVQPDDAAGGGPGGGEGGDEGAGVQPSRQVEAGANDNELPFTGFAAVPILLGGLVLLTAGLALRRRSGQDA